MILDHLAAILLFSGPLFYIGLWMVVDPAGIARLPELLVRVFRNLIQTSGGVISEEIRESENAAISRRVRTVLRFAGVALLLIAIVA
jgi:hypothetical protein